MKKSKFTEEQIVRILQGAATGQKANAQLCSEDGVNLNTFYILEAQVSQPTNRRPCQLRDLEKENAQLKKHLARCPG